MSAWLQAGSHHYKHWPSTVPVRSKQYFQARRRKSIINLTFVQLSEFTTLISHLSLNFQSIAGKSTLHSQVPARQPFPHFPRRLHQLSRIFIKQDHKCELWGCRTDLNTWSAPFKRTHHIWLQETKLFPYFFDVEPQLLCFCYNSLYGLNLTYTQNSCLFLYCFAARQNSGKHWVDNNSMEVWGGLNDFSERTLKTWKNLNSHLGGWWCQISRHVVSSSVYKGCVFGEGVERNKCFFFLFHLLLWGVFNELPEMIIWLSEGSMHWGTWAVHRGLDTWTEEQRKWVTREGNYWNEGKIRRDAYLVKTWLETKQNKPVKLTETPKLSAYRYSLSGNGRYIFPANIAERQFNFWSSSEFQQKHNQISKFKDKKEIPLKLRALPLTSAHWVITELGFA